MIESIVYNYFGKGRILKYKIWIRLVIKLLNCKYLYKIFCVWNIRYIIICNVYFICK